MPRVATYVFIDLETTGIPKEELNKTRITEISMVAVKSDHILDTRPGAAPRVQQKVTLCLNPRRMVQPGATKTTGLCNDLLEHETNFNLQVFNILDTFLNVLTKPVCLIAQNGLGFDFPIIKRHLEHLKVSFNEDLLCADSYHAFYDILEEKQKKEALAANKSKEDLTAEVTKDASTSKVQASTDKPVFDATTDVVDFTSMQKQNETTPKQQMIRNNTPIKAGKARRRFPWSEGNKPKASYKLKNIYERLLNRPALNAHRAEVDCILMMEAAVAISNEFVLWVEENNKPFSEVRAMSFGVPIGE